jgi:hypothetical protein
MTSHKLQLLLITILSATGIANLSSLLTTHETALTPSKPVSASPLKKSGFIKINTNSERTQRWKKQLNTTKELNDIISTISTLETPIQALTIDPKNKVILLTTQ